MVFATSSLLPEDLEHILNHTRGLWEDLRNKRIFITGGTGFFGCWLLESFVWVNRKLNLNAKAVILTRSFEKFAKKCSHLCYEPSLSFQEGDICDFEFPEGEFAYIIHAATEASITLNSQNAMFNTIVEGTKHTLDFATQCGAKGLLMTSSGAIYGKQPHTMSHISEEYILPSNDLIDNKSAYSLGKRQAEEICALYAEKFNLNIKIARCFAFVGPHLPLDAHFAIGNFIQNGLHGHPIEVKSDGSSVRSYLYASDLAIWLWTILFRGKTMRPYNVGSDKSLSIRDLAYIVESCFQSGVGVNIHQTIPDKLCIERYVPNVSRVKKELGLIPTINLWQAIKLTKKWHLLKTSKDQTLTF